ncbi:hypothetical protein E0W68_08435 [Flavobacterium salilacus subsp. salilacus]|uniref:hypothetical protein n=1 Tax=Flavobacterium TaxID=237 RepID=UPI0010758773|nr:MULTISPECIES: hypothetical protein [Flavobacterium]KAF2518767.1 hypothetical protein E0W68_08435 [Flavobacterium salilacus subsp. salilacus]MBE1613735.1 hypothetical protein [Flavobacterium sp. SaA2.13]
MKKIFYLSFTFITVMVCSCSTEDTASETEIQTVVDNQETVVAEKFDKDALAKAFASAWENLNIDFTKLFIYATTEEANKEIQEFLLNVQQEAKWGIEECQGSDTMVFRFSLQKGVGRTREIHFINIQNNKVIKSIINDGENNLKEKEIAGSINQIGLNRNTTGWFAVDVNDANLSGYTQFEVIADANSVQVFAAQ